MTRTITGDFPPSEYALPNYVGYPTMPNAALLWELKDQDRLFALLERIAIALEKQAP